MKNEVPSKRSIMVDMSEVLRYTTFKHLNIDIRNNDARNNDANDIKNEHMN